MPITLNGTTGASFPDGSAGTPAEKGSTSSTAGVFYPAANTVAISTNSTEALRIDSSQNVGIGTTSPTAFGAGYVTLTISGSNAGVFQSKLTGNDCRFYATSTETLFGNWAATPLRFLTNSTEAARIDTSGNFLVNTTSVISLGKQSIAFNGLTEYGIGIKTTYSGSGSSFAAFVNSGGTIQGSIYANATNSVQFLTSSDYRLKQNVKPMQNALATISQLKPVTFNWKSDGSDGQGFIAHELQKIVPDCVAGEKDAVDANGNPKYQGVDTSFLVATLTAAIQELSAKLDAAEARIAALETA